MTGHDLKVWLVTNHYTQQTLADALGLTVKTVNNYCNNKPPKWLGFALGVDSLAKPNNKNLNERG